MRFILASFVVATGFAEEVCDQKEQVSMLQTKDRVGLSVKALDLIKAVNEASPMFEDDADVAQFVNGVKTVIGTMKELDSEEALLQRASQSKDMQDLIGRFQALPSEKQDKLEVAGGKIFDKLPVPQRAALVQQVSHALDSSTEGKAQTTTEKTAEGKATTTYNADTGYYHRHYHGRRGTESTSVGKRGGHRHTHSYQHNGQGGQATTASSSRGLTGHEHSHTHSHRLNNGVTSTDTFTRTRFANGDVHEHAHDHAHRSDIGTATNTKSTFGDHSHFHSHGHNERNGDSKTDSNTRSNGRRTWHHAQHTDGKTGAWTNHVFPDVSGVWEDKGDNRVTINER